MTAFNPPLIDWAGLAPVLIVLGGAVLGVLLEAFVPRVARRPVQIAASMGVLIAAAVTVSWRWAGVLETGSAHLASNAIVEDPAGLFAQLTILVIALLSVPVIADRTSAKDGAIVAVAATKPGSAEEATATRQGRAQTEIYPLMLFATGGMMVFSAAGDLLTLFIALEVFSLPLYIMTAMARRRRLLSQEAALKYFVLGAFAAAFMLFGSGLLYGFAGSFTLEAIGNAVPAVSGMDWVFYAGIVCLSVGLLFKVGAAPFHAWTPDVYQGAPTPITGFMAAATKVAAFAALLRVYYVVAVDMAEALAPAMWTIIILTMVVGTVMGIVQSDIKRMLAFSSVAHAGFVLLGVTALTPAGISSVLFYLFGYGISTVGAFAIITLVRQQDARGAIVGEAGDLKMWAGLGKRNPILAVSMTVFLLSFAGIPLTAGFVGKFTVFAAAIAAGNWPLVVIAVAASAATAYFYFRLIVLMFFEQEEDNSTVVVISEGMSSSVIALAAGATVILGVIPGPVLDLAQKAAMFIP